MSSAIAAFIAYAHIQTLSNKIKQEFVTFQNHPTPEHLTHLSTLIHTFNSDILAKYDPDIFIILPSSMATEVFNHLEQVKQIALALLRFPLLAQP